MSKPCIQKTSTGEGQEAVLQCCHTRKPSIVRRSSYQGTPPCMKRTSTAGEKYAYDSERRSAGFRYRKRPTVGISCCQRCPGRWHLLLFSQNNRGVLPSFVCSA